MNLELFPSVRKKLTPVVKLTHAQTAKPLFRMQRMPRAAAPHLDFVGACRGNELWRRTRGSLPSRHTPTKQPSRTHRDRGLCCLTFALVVGAVGGSNMTLPWTVDPPRHQIDTLKWNAELPKWSRSWCSTRRQGSCWIWCCEGLWDVDAADVIVALDGEV